ncbi:MAG: glycosyltransferase [Hyphomicrobiaceae bacterium]|nr:glycosyltransferase [Hyphomicrobiaceae bacterium]
MALKSDHSRAIRCSGRQPLVSVIIPHLDDVDRLRMCAQAIEAQSLPRQHVEIVVGDNGSRCGIDAVQRAAPSARLVSVAERGAGPARNHAVLAARGDVLAFTDSDCIPSREWLTEGLAALGHADMVGGAMMVSVADPDRPTGAEAFEMAMAFDNRRYVEEQGFSVTANLLVRRDVFEAVGGFRTGVPEDLDWCRRAATAGYTLSYAPRAVVSHPARQSFAALARKWRRLTDEAWADQVGTPYARWLWAARAAAVAASPLLHGPRLMTTSRIPGIAPRARAAGVLLRLRILRAQWMLEQAIAGASPVKRDTTGALCGIGRP